MSTYTLAMPGVEPLVIDRTTGYKVQASSWQPGEPREVVSDAPGIDGTLDTTRLHGAAGA